MEIMHTMASEAIAPNPKRRVYSPELKARVVVQCQADGASFAAVALAHGIKRQHRSSLATRAPGGGTQTYQSVHHGQRSLSDSRTVKRTVVFFD